MGFCTGGKGGEDDGGSVEWKGGGREEFGGGQKEALAVVSVVERG